MDSIHLLHYRNYTDATFELGQHTLFIGPNGSGKTNVIEALRTLSVTKSYRVTQDRDAIQWDEPYCRIELKTDEELFEYILTTEKFGVKKVIKHNGTAIPLTQVYGLLPTVLFSPETMHLIDGPPLERRRFLDTILSQANREYLDALMTYRKVLRERHFVLLRLQQGLGHTDELDFWDHELVRTGSIIIRERELFITELNRLLREIYPQFVDASDAYHLELRYKPAVPSEDFPNKLRAMRSYDIKTASTNTGPARDEVVFLLRDRDITLFASRGELRRCVLAVKLAEAVYLRDDRQMEPWLLLDDVFSELDEARRSSFLETIKTYRTVITTTDAAFIAEHPLANEVIHRLPLEEPDKLLSSDQESSKKAKGNRKSSRGTT